jgi:hypothetical protein
MRRGVALQFLSAVFDGPLAVLPGMRIDVEMYTDG